MAQIRFVSSITESATQREKELERAAQLSHSAKQAHAKRQARVVDALGIYKKPVAASGHSSTLQRRGTDMSNTDVDIALDIPSPLLFEGCRDPFDAATMTITPEINRIISFTRDAYLPSLYIPNFVREHPDADPPSSRLIANMILGGSPCVFRDFAFGFSSPGVLTAWIPAQADALARVLPGEASLPFRKLATEYRVRSIRNLRLAIDRQRRMKTRPTLSLILQILYLFRAECNDGVRLAARYHAGMLPLLDEVEMTTAQSLKLIVVAMWSDTDMACKSMTRPLLDYEGWLEQRLRAFWDYTVTFLPPQPPAIVADLHAGIAQGDAVVRDAMLRGRYCLEIRDTVGPFDLHSEQNNSRADFTYQWTGTTTMHDFGLLMNHLLDLIEEVNPHPPEKRHAMRQATAISALYTIRKFVHESRFNGIDINDAPRLMPTGQEILEPFAEVMESLATDITTQEQLFWIYFTGVWHERQVRRNTKELTKEVFPDAMMGTAKDTWFARRLAAQARKLNLTSWESADALLRKFLFSDIMRPHPREWYETLVRCSDCGSRKSGRGSIPVGS